MLPCYFLCIVTVWYGCVMMYVKGIVGDVKLMVKKWPLGTINKRTIQWIIQCILTLILLICIYILYFKSKSKSSLQRNRNRMHYQPSSLPDPAFTAPRLSHYGLTPGLYALRGKYCPLPDIKHYCTQYPSAPISLCYINIWDFSQYYPITPMWSMG